MIRDDIIAYLESAIPPGVSVDSVAVDTDLIATGIIDSFGIVGILSFIEEQFDITVADEDIDPEIFRTVTTIETYVEQNRETAS